MRIIVTGSRTWTNAVVVRSVLDGFAYVAMMTGQSLTIIHGNCDDGADAHAKRWVRRYSRRWIPGDRLIDRSLTITDEPYDAEWSRYGKPAGPIRNGVMVRSGADLCIAFHRDNSSGTADCIQQAKAAGIPVLPIRWEDLSPDRRASIA